MTDEKNTETENKNSAELEFQIISPAGHEYEVFKNATPDQIPWIVPGFNADLVKGRFGNLVFYNHKGPACEVWLSVYQIEEPTILIGKMNRSLLEWHNAIENCIDNTWDGVKAPKSRKYQSNMSYIPFVDNKAEFPKKGRYVTCDFHFKTPFLEHYAPHYPLLDQFLHSIKKSKRAASLMQTPFVLSYPLIEGIRRIISYDLPAALANEFLEKSVPLLFMNMIDGVSKLDPGKLSFTNQQIEGVLHVASYIEKNLTNNLTIEALSKEAKTNQCTFQKCFREKLGKTVHRYVIDQRINKAKDLLLEPNSDIQDVANKIGIGDPNCFFRMFKKYVQMTPDQFRKSHR